MGIYIIGIISSIRIASPWSSLINGNTMLAEANNRLLTGVGGRYEFLDSGRFRLAVGSGLMMEHEAWKGEDGAIERTLPKYSNYLTVGAQFNETIILKLTNCYQLGFDAKSDLWRQRYSTDFSVSFQFTKKAIDLHKLLIWAECQGISL
jgi:hypothetical protein